MKQKITLDQVADFEKVNFSSKKEVSGVYGIVFIKNNSRVKIYVGSSVNIVSRCRDHIRELDKGTHVSSLMTELYSNKYYEIQFVILERCSSDEILQKEREYQYKWNLKYLLNKWRAVSADDIIPWLEKAIESKGYRNGKISETKFYNNTPCKEGGSAKTKKYPKMNIKIDGKSKSLMKHRVAYWEAYGTYPELVRHMCDNPYCYNPKHLKAGNYSDNNIDKRGDFPERFEKDWVRLQGDRDKLSELYGWKRNCTRAGTKVSTAAYRWERVLNLRDKYPDIFYNHNRNRKCLWKRKDVVEFMQECEARHGLCRNINQKLAEDLNNKYNLNLTNKEVSNIKTKLKGRTKERKRVENSDSTGAAMLIKDNYERYTDEELVVVCNKQLGTSYKIGTIRSLRYDMGLYKPKMIQDVVGDLYRRDSMTSWGIEVEKLVEHFGHKYSDAELAQICCREFGEDKGFDEDVIRDIRGLVGSGGLI